MTDESRAAEIAALRKQLAGLSLAADLDPADVELAWLRAQVKLLASEITRRMEPPKPREWVTISGTDQCWPADLVMGGYPALHAAGFRWDGNTLVFPADWPKADPSHE